MISRRDFLKSTSILTTSFLLNGYIVTKLADLETRKDRLVYKGNIFNLYKMRALALFEKENQSYESLNNLIDKIEELSKLDDITKNLKEDCVQTSLYYSTIFQKKLATKTKHDLARFELRTKINDYRNLIIKISNFWIFQKDDGDCILSNEDSCFFIPEQYLDVMIKYNEKAVSLIKSKSSEDNIKRRIANTIINSAPEIKDINLVSQSENIPLNVLMAISTIESLGNPFAIGRNGEVGRFQITPKVAEMFLRKYGNKFSFGHDELLENLVRDQSVNARFSALILKENNLPYPEGAVAYNQGLTKVISMDLPLLRSHWYGTYFEQIYSVLESMTYLT